MFEIAKLLSSIGDEQHAIAFYADCRSVCRCLLQMQKILSLDKNGKMILGSVGPLLIELVKRQQRATESGR